LDQQRDDYADAASLNPAQRLRRHVIRSLLALGESPARVLVGWATDATCSEVLEHVDDPKRLMVRSRTLLAPGCRLVVTVPGGPMSCFARHIGHRRHFTPSGLALVPSGPA